MIKSNLLKKESSKNLGHRHASIPGIRQWKNKGNGFAIFQIHYTAHPDKRTEKWLKETKKGYTDEEWAREYELSWNIDVGKPVFSFTLSQLLPQCPYIPKETLYRGWDFGYTHPAVGIVKFDDKDRICAIYSKIGNFILFSDFIKLILKELSEKFPNAKYVDFCDPAGRQRSDKSEKTSIGFLHDKNIFPQSKYSGIIDGLNIMKEKMKLRGDGNYGFMVEEGQQDLIDALSGGYHYPTRKVSEIPQKDGYYDNIIDAFRYIFINLFPNTSPMEKETPLIQDNEEIFGKTGF